MAKYDAEDETEVIPKDELADVPEAQFPEADFAPEYDSSEEIAQESDGIMPPPPRPIPVHPEPAESAFSKYQALMQQYKDLQDNQQDGLLTAGLLQGGAQVGQAMAGKYSGNFKPDLSGVDMMKEIANQPLKSYEQKQLAQAKMIGLQDELQARDPGSRMSQTYRQYAAAKLGMNLPPDVSAFDISQLLKAAGKPSQQASKFQKANGYVIDQNGHKQKVQASFEVSTGKFFKPGTAEEIPGFQAESLTPYQIVKDPLTGNRQQFDKGTGGHPSQIDVTPQIPQQNASPDQVWTGLDPNNRARIDKEYKPAFNKATEKTRQRLTHVPVIMQRLQEAQTNAAALPQLKAEMARFDVGDQRLAQQEFDMFAKRMGYKGLQDWTSAHSTGTITKDFADEMGKAVKGVEKNLRGSLSKEAEIQAELLRSRMPKGQQPPVHAIAPLIYGEYARSLQLKEKKSGKVVPIKADKYDAAIKSGLFEKVD